jgi:hypothetical protein
LLTVLLVNSDIDQAIVLATGEEGSPPVVPQGVKFIGLGEETRAELTLRNNAAWRNAKQTEAVPIIHRDTGTESRMG